ncbi:hypothetical protein OB920_12890 [Halobacteria archaeon HArc-gm2]|nr:hypothetical protein [Halobacteria archaeon HArc-gm2]
MNRLLDPRRESNATEPLDGATASDDGGSARGGLRKALFALGVLGLAYLAVRRAGRSERAPSMDEVRETVDDVRSGDDFEIPIGESGEESPDQRDSAMGAGTTEGAIGNEPMPGEDLSSGRPADQDDPDRESTGSDTAEESEETDASGAGTDETAEDESGEADTSVEAIGERDEDENSAETDDEESA